MANISEEDMNSTLNIFLDICYKEIHFGFTFCYTIMGLCFLVGTPAHLWCFWINFCNEQKIKDTQMFLLNYIIMEIIYSIECGIELITTLLFYDNDILWILVYFFFGLSWTGRPLLQVCICIEQYLAVIYPVTFLRYKGIKYRIPAVVTAWLMAFAYGVYEFKTMIFPDYIYTSIFITALAVILFCCVSVLCALKTPGPGDTHGTKQTGKDGGNQQKRNAFNTILSALLLNLFTYLPQAMLTNVTRAAIDPVLLACDIIPFLISLNILGVIITPLLKLYKECQKTRLNSQKEITVTSGTQL